MTVDILSTRRSLYLALLGFAICTLLPLDPVLGQNNWSEGWEGNWFETWQIDTGTWDVGIATSGPAKAYAGAHVAATVLDGNYSEDVDSRLISPPIQLPGADQEPRLRFWHWYSFSNRDTARVQIKVEDGEWQTISSPYTGSSSKTWSRPALDLAPFAGNTVEIAFYFTSRQQGGRADVSDGWYIDDVALVTGTPVFDAPEDWEAGLGDWRVDQGTWEVGGKLGIAHSGEKTAATALGGNYDEDVDSRLISPPIQLPGADQQPRLRFWHRYNFSDLDTAQVQIKVDDGEWQDLSPPYTGSSSNAWSRPALDLAPFAGNTVEIAFHFTSLQLGNNADVASGWDVDDIDLVTGPLLFNAFEDWETGLGDWRVDQGTWEVGGGPGTAHSGENTAATVLGGNYDEDVDSRLISPPIQLPSADQQPRLRFWHRYHIAARDTARVQIKVDGGEWQDFSPPYTGSSSNTWSRPALNLAPFAGNTAQFALHFSSQQEGNNTDVDRGWYVDDLEIVTGAPTFSLPEGWEAGLGDWRVDQGTWEVGGGPGSAHAGENTAATALNDNYDEGVASRLISPSFRVPDVGSNPYLIFWHRFSFSARDTARVQIRVDAGAWQTISPPFIGSSNNTWERAAVDLSSYINTAAELAFHFASLQDGDKADVSTGWYVDDIDIIDLEDDDIPSEEPSGEDEPRIVLSATVLNFGAVAANATGERVLSISNAGKAALTVDLDTSTDEYRVVPTSVQLDPGTSADINVTFAPLEEGSTETQLRLTSNDPDAPALTVLLLGETPVQEPLEAPGPPADLTVEGGQQWSRERAFALTWTDPPTQSGIARTHYKLGSQPAAADDETGNFSGSAPVTVVVEEEGEHTLYLWLESADGGVDFDQWATATLRYDATPPPPAALSAPAADTWLNTSEIAFSWEETQDLLSGLAGYLLFVDGVQVDSTSQITLMRTVAPGTHEWSIVAVDLAGNSSAPAMRTLRLDDTAPQNPSRISAWADNSRAAAIVDGDWYAAATPHFEWSGAIDDSAGVASYAIRFTTDASDTVALTDMQSATTYTAAPSSDGQTYYLRLRTADRAGNWSAATTLFTYRYDVSPPTLESEPISNHRYNSNLPLAAAIADAGAVESAFLHYRAGGEERFTPLAMSLSGDMYEAPVPGEFVTRRGFEYYFEATDQAGNSATLPATGAQKAFALQVTFSNFAAPVAHAADLWRMVSLPVLPDEGDPLRRLAGLGVYDPLQWRFFRYTGNAYRELTREEVGNFAPGRAFWLHARTSDFILNSGSGRTTALENAFEIILEPGWNTIAVPFAFPVRWSDIAAASDNPAGVMGPYAYDGSAWSTPRSTDQLDPWQGYAVKNANAGSITLQIPPRAADRRGKVATSTASWTLQISAIANRTRDVANFIGFATDAQNTWDRRDLPEPPPPPGSHLKLYMPHADWPLYPDAYTADFRPPAPTAEWDFVVESSEATEVQLSFNSIGALPPARTTRLLDLDRRIAVKLQEISTYSIVLDAWEHRRFRVVVGTSDQADDLTASFPALPSAYTLEQNHPNPFNAETLISYRLAERGPVRLTVHDLLGRQLAVLVDQIQNQGHHSLKWDGANTTDHNTASGIYFYTLETPMGRLTRKMVLLR